MSEGENLSPDSPMLKIGRLMENPLLTEGDDEHEKLYGN